MWIRARALCAILFAFGALASTGTPVAAGTVADELEILAELFEPGCRTCGSGTEATDRCGGPIATASGVQLFSGTFILTQEDLRIAGRGQDFVWRRVYRSRGGRNTPLGSGWSHSYDLYVEVFDRSPGEVQDVRFADASTLTWSPTPGATSYCAQRSISPDDFTTAELVGTPGSQPTVVDATIPQTGQVLYYLVAATANGRQGSLGRATDGVTRAGLACGLPGTDVVLHDGTGRYDFFRPDGGGRWTAEEFFHVFQGDPETGLTLVRPDTSQWQFAAVDGSPAAGRITAMIDRNGNALTFAYDGFGRLEQITDTLDRPITIQYDGNGLLTAVVDFTGREVRYAHYGANEQDGLFGDLKSARSPIVVGTPTGNDFPLGKTTVYTYATGTGDPRLDHNLLTVRDPRQQTFLVNEYATTTDPSDLLFDRVVGQTWGDPGDRIDFDYDPGLAFRGAAEFAICTIVNDRVGNVEDRCFDADNRNLRRREWTGRADPDLPTTATANRPGLPLRGTDPPFFETAWTYNADALATAVTRPNLDGATSTYDELNTDRRARGNLLGGCRQPGPLGGDQPELCETFEYDDGFGAACCGTNFVTRHVDARGNDTVHTYDANGNRLTTRHRLPSIVETFEYNTFGQMAAHTHPDNGAGCQQRDLYEYYTPADGPANGYLARTIVGAGTFDHVSSYEYDDVGNRLRIVDPRGGESLYAYNALDQIVQELSRPVDGSGLRYETLAYFDANDNLVRIDVENVDASGVPAPNPYLTTEYEYDILNERLSSAAEVEEGRKIIEEYEYDANRNRTVVRKGAATSGDRPANTIHTLYDERDLEWRRTRALGDADQSTDQLDYDGNANLLREVVGLEDTPRTSQWIYDGYDRSIETIDPMGNTRQVDYDANSNATGTRTFGELADESGNTNNVRLYESTMTYDAMDRLTDRDAAHFDLVAQTPIGDGLSAAHFDFNDRSLPSRVVDDGGDETFLEYDCLGRRDRIVDAVGNQTSFAYDANSNVIWVVEDELSDLGLQPESFVSEMDYDGLDRMELTRDNHGNEQLFSYDSRDNPGERIDALGNVVRYEYDGLNRLIAATADLTDDGTGTGQPLGVLRTDTVWDDSSRIVAMVDDNGNQTTYSYDALDRRVGTLNADGTVLQRVYDVHGNVVAVTDPNGTVTGHTYDLNDRRRTSAIAVGQGVSPDTTFVGFDYDGLNRPVRAEDDDSVVEHGYDSLGNRVFESLDNRQTTSFYDGDGNRTTCTYPGGRTVSYQYDALDRVKQCGDGQGPIVQYDRIGPRRVQQRTLLRPNAGLATDYEYDDVRLPARIVHRAIEGQSTISDIGHVWDAAYNRSLRIDLDPQNGPRQDVYAYDSVYRLVHSTTEVNQGNLIRDARFDYDGVGNRLFVQDDVCPDGPYFLDQTTPEPADFQCNQYSQTPCDQRFYDPNGNVVAAQAGQGSTTDLVFDYRDRLVALQVQGAGPIATFAYDAYGRRIALTTAQSSTRFYHDGWNVVEERDGQDQVTATYVHGRRVDEVVQMQRGNAEYHYHQDDLGNVLALTDAGAQIVERYEYRDFGYPTVYDANGQPRSESTVGNPYLFAGRRWDVETGLYYNRMRYLEPASGRFVQRDPLGAWGDGHNLGNAFTYAGNNPHTRIDPTGLREINVHCAGPWPGPRMIRLELQLEDEHSFCDGSMVESVACKAFRAAGQAWRDVTNVLRWRMTGSAPSFGGREPWRRILESPIPTGFGRPFVAEPRTYAPPAPTSMQLEQTAANLELSFPAPEEPLSVDRIARISRGFHDAYRGAFLMDRIRTRCATLSCGGGTIGYWSGSSGRVSLCRSFFTGSESYAGAMLVEELLHGYGDVGHLRGFDRNDSPEEEADFYQHFVLNFYLRD